MKYLSLYAKMSCKGKLFICYRLVFSYDKIPLGAQLLRHIYN